MNGARKNQNAREASPKTHIQTSQASRGTRPASYVRTSAALVKFQARTHHDESPRIPPFVDVSSSTPRSPVRGRDVRGSSRGCPAPRATEPEPHPNKNQLVPPRVALGRFSRRRRRRRTWATGRRSAHAALQRKGCSHRE